MLTLELAVVLPAAALVILSALHLKSIERDRGVQAAFQRDFTQVLAISEKQINQKAYELIDDVRDQFPASGPACAETGPRRAWDAGASAPCARPPARSGAHT